MDIVTVDWGEGQCRVLVARSTSTACVNEGKVTPQLKTDASKNKASRQGRKSRMSSLGQGKERDE